MALVILLQVWGGSHEPPGAAQFIMSVIIGRPKCGFAARA
jgi:hypothetical protein